MKGNPVTGGDDYEAEADVAALSRAHEVKSDPKRHAKAKEHAKKKLAEHDKKGEALKKIASRDERSAQIGKAFTKK